MSSNSYLVTKSIILKHDGLFWSVEGGGLGRARGCRALVEPHAVVDGDPEVADDVIE